jgi:hypothetical protein
MNGKYLSSPQSLSHQRALVLQLMPAQRGRKIVPPATEKTAAETP